MMAAQPFHQLIMGKENTTTIAHTTAMEWQLQQSDGTAAPTLTKTNLWYNKCTVLMPDSFISTRIPL